MAEPLACAVLGMRRLGPVFGDPVVVTGPAPWACCCSCCCRPEGGPVAVLDKVGERLEVARQAGRCPGRHRRRRARWGTLGGRGRCHGGAGGDRDRVGLPGHGGRVVVFGVSSAPAALSISPFRVYSGEIVITGPMAIVRSFGRPDGGYRTQPLLRRAGLDRVPAGAISISSRARNAFLVSHCVPSPIPVSRPLRRRYRCRTARLGSKPGSVLIAPEPGGGLGRRPGCDLVAFGERPDRLDARAAGHRPGRPRAHDRPGGPV